jgi:lauroyl/myristoyl acyltransferase
VVLENLALALPALGRVERRRIASQCFEHVAVTTLETFWVSAQSREGLAEHIVVQGIERYAAASRGRGVIAVTAHSGSWDLLACAQALAGVPLTVVTKRLAAAGLSRLWKPERARGSVWCPRAARGSPSSVHFVAEMSWGSSWTNGPTKRTGGCSCPFSASRRGRRRRRTSLRGVRARR